MDKTRRLNLKITDARPFVMVVIVILIALVIGVSFIVIPSTYAPLLLLAVVVTITALIVWLKKPVWSFVKYGGLRTRSSLGLVVMPLEKNRR
jgi:hypothetical protein